jgi:hypothetical protein
LDEIIDDDKAKLIAMLGGQSKHKIYEKFVQYAMECSENMVM